MKSVKNLEIHTPWLCHRSNQSVGCDVGTGQRGMTTLSTWMQTRAIIVHASDTSLSWGHVSQRHLDPGRRVEQDNGVFWRQHVNDNWAEHTSAATDTAVTDKFV